VFYLFHSLKRWDVCHNIRDRHRETETKRRKSERGRERDSERSKMRRHASFSLSFPSFFLVKRGRGREGGMEGGPRRKGGRAMHVIRLLLLHT